MNIHTKAIPRPLVKVNQWFIVINVVFSLIFSNEYFLLLPLIVGLSSLIFKYNPVINIGKKFLSKEPKEYILEDYEQQQFNQVIAVFCLMTALISYSIGWSLLGIVFSAMVGAASFIAILGFCVGCFIRFQWQQFKYRRAKV